MKLKLFTFLICSQLLLLATGKGQAPKKTAGTLSFDCSPLPLSGCNLIPNPEFSLINPSDLLSAFSIGNVLDWDAYELSPDANASGHAPRAAPPLPAAIAGVNYASMVVSNPNFGEAMAARISQVGKGKTYALSFFLSSTGEVVPWDSGCTFTLRVMLTHCSSPPTLKSEQLVFCETFTRLTGRPWQQYFATFTAAGDYDMIVIEPEQDTLTGQGNTYLHLAYPELINVTDLITAGDMDSHCQLTLSACGVKNSQFEWKDVMGNVVGNNPTLDVNAATARGYTLRLTVPGGITPNNTCSNNFPEVTVYKGLPLGCNCGTLRVTRAVAGYYKWDETGLYSQNLDVCNNNILCDNENELLKLTLSSSHASGNRWEFFSNNPDIPIEANFNFTTGNANTQHIEGYAGMSPNATGMIEIRLTNTTLNEVKSVFFKIVSHWDDPNQCTFFARTAAPNRTQIVTVETATATETVKVKPSVNVYPNPVTTAFRINATKKVKEVVVRSVEGRVVKRFAAPVVNQALSIAELSKGTYVTEIIFEDRTSVSSIIIRQ